MRLGLAIGRTKGTCASPLAAPASSVKRPADTASPADVYAHSSYDPSVAGSSGRSPWSTSSIEEPAAGLVTSPPQLAILVDAASTSTGTSVCTRRGTRIL